MFIRPYTWRDKSQVQALFFETVRHINIRDYSQEQVEIWAPETPNEQAWSRLKDQYCYVVEKEKNILAFASLSNDGLVDFMFVDRRHQGRGLASGLLRQLERTARKLDLTTLRAEVSITARPFFESKGFTTIRENRKKIGTTEFTNYWMEKSL